MPEIDYTEMLGDLTLRTIQSKAYENNDQSFVKVFPPDHDYKIWWDIIGVTAILYQSIMIPYKISFKELMKDP